MDVVAVADVSAVVVVFGVAVVAVSPAATDAADGRAGVVVVEVVVPSASLGVANACDALRI